MRIKYISVIILIAISIFCSSCVDHKLPGPVNCSEDPVILELISVADSDCALQNGSLEVLASGGTGNYLYKLGAEEAQISSVFQNLSAGVYEVSAVDGNNCSSALDVVVQNKNGLSITFQTTEAGCDGSSGSIIVTPFNGVEPYEYKINNSAIGADSTFTNLAADVHTVVVTDNTGCVLTQDVKVRSGISYTASIAPIIQTNCIVSGCHNGSQFPDFRIFKNIQDNAGQIKTLTGNRTMPEEGSLTQNEIDMIACWVDDGAADN